MSVLNNLRKALLLILCATMPLTGSAKEMKPIVISRGESVEGIHKRLEAGLVGVNISKLTSLFPAGSYESVTAIDMSGMGEEDFFNSISQEPLFSGTVRVFLAIRKKSVFSLWTPRLSFYIEINGGVIEKTHSINWYTK